ncbi:MAG: sugar phosphate isomerase/epimerase [Rhodothermales bacterium]
MQTRRTFLLRSGAAAGAIALPLELISGCAGSRKAPAGSLHVDNIGVQLYTFRDAMLNDPRATLALIADLGFKEIESAGSPKGHYYGLTSVEMKDVCDGLGMVLRSGHVALDENFDATMDEAAAADQEYVICSSMPTSGQSADNYKSAADAFNEAGEQCARRGLKFGYHNHDYEFESEGGHTLYDVLLDNTDPDLVHMEMDLGWVVASGKDPLDYFARYPGRFPLWHLKDVSAELQKSTEFGKGSLDIPAMLRNREASGVRHIFVEQEDYAVGPEEAMRYDLAYLREILMRF